MTSRPPRPRVLLIDDNALVLKATARMLRRAYQVTAVSAASYALDLLAAGERFDAIVCDVEMPRLKGWDLYRRARLADPDIASRIVRQRRRSCAADGSHHSAAEYASR